MKKLMNKNQVIITTLAIIIAIAGYFNYQKTYTPPETSKTNTNTQETAKVSGQINDDITDVGEAVLTNAQVGDFVAKAKLEREQTHGKAQDALNAVIKDENTKDSVKQDAIDKLCLLSEYREMETATENLLGAKGFLNSIVTIENQTVDVLINKQEISKVERGQIEDIVTRKTGFKVSDIVITTMKIQ